MVAKPEWGTKRICPSCGTRYYDLLRDPIVCPKCSAPFDPEAFLRARRARPPIPVEKPLEPVGGLGLQSPAVMLVAFFPMACIAAAYYYMNRADPDCGTTFAWMTRSMGPWLGWQGGWAIVVADVLVMPSLSSVAGHYTFSLFGNSNPSDLDVTIVGVAWIVLMTAICYIGIELSARTQQFLLGLEFFTLILFAVSLGSFVALVAYELRRREPLIEVLSTVAGWGAEPSPQSMVAAKPAAVSVGSLSVKVATGALDPSATFLVAAASTT